MKKQIILQMISRFQNGSGEVRRSLQAQYQLLDAEARLAYKQQLDPERPETVVPEVLTIRLNESGEPIHIIMKRPGSLFHLVFEVGEPCQSVYDTPAGRMDIRLLTQKMDGKFAADLVKLSLWYEFQIGGESQGTTELTLRSL